MRAFLGFLSLLAVCLLPGPAAGQGVFRGLTISPGLAGWSGEGFEGLETGPRLQASAFVGTENRVAIGLTGSWAAVGSDLDDVDASELGIGLTARLELGDADAVRPLLEGYAGWTRLSLDSRGAVPSVKESGLALGPGVGLLVPLGTLHLVIGADYRWHRYGSLRLDHDSLLGEVGASGWRWGAGVGLYFGR